VTSKVATHKEINFAAIEEFISKVCKVENLNWSDLHLLRKIRNRLVHHNGHIPEGHDIDSLAQRIKKTKGLNIDNARTLLVDASYVDGALIQVRNFFETIFDARKFGSPNSLSFTDMFDHGAILINEIEDRIAVTLTSDFKSSGPKSDLPPESATTKQ
jgi:hypothetical protein